VPKTARKSVIILAPAFPIVSKIGKKLKEKHSKKKLPITKIGATKLIKTDNNKERTKLGKILIFVLLIY
jgi:hypothetical protein